MTKISIPHTVHPECPITAVLEQADPSSTSGRDIALILHGAAGHKDYLFQKRLAQRLPIDSCRFDFRGSHETPGEWKQGDLAGDVLDLQTVVGHLKSTYGYRIRLLVGHSRGSVVATKWITTSQEGREEVTGFVNASGRFRMQTIYAAPAYKDWQEAWDTKGYYIWEPIVARKKLTITITPEDVAEFASWDTGVDHFPQHIDVLTVHGLSDQTVSPYDAVLYAQTLGERDPGRHSLHLVEGGDHNFSGKQDEIAGVILDWWDFKTTQHGALRSGVWKPRPGKL